MTLHQQHLGAIDKRKLRNFDRDAFQSFNAEELETAATACAEISKEYAKGFARWIKTSGYENVHDEQKYWVNIKAPVGHIYKDTDQLLSLYDEHLAKLEKEKIK